MDETTANYDGTVTFSAGIAALALLLAVADAAIAYHDRTSIVGSPETHEAWRRLVEAIGKWRGGR